MIPAAVAIGLAIAAAGYALGRIDANPFKVPALAAAPMDSTQLAKSLYERCRSLTGEARTNCYSGPLDSLAAVGEVRVAMGALGRLGTLDSHVRRDGHVLAHGIGIAGGRRGGDVASTFAMCDESFQSGCYHGVIQAYFASAGRVGPDEVNALCEPFRGPEADRWIRFQCVHGMGHGLEMVYDHYLPKALAACDYLLEDWDRRSCYGGAFMENIVNVTIPKHPAHGLDTHASASNPSSDDHADHSGQAAQVPNPPFAAMDPKDPLYPCSIMQERYLVSCYEMQTSVILYLNGGDIGKAAQTCDTAPRLMRYVCYQSLGRDISAYAMQDHARSIGLCSLGTPAYQPWCYVGLVKNFVDLNARADDGLAFCRRLTGPRNKVKCYEAVGEQIATLRNQTEQRRDMCQSSEPAYLEACFYGARVSPVEPELLRALNREAYGG